jgi:hypothetical protein
VSFGIGMIAGCVAEPPAIPLPIEARPVRTPQDMEAVWLDVQESKIRERITVAFGRVEIAAYRLPQAWTWEKLHERFDNSLTESSLQRYERLPQSPRHFRLAVWSRNGKESKPMIALAEVLPPASSPAVHHVILVITPHRP